MLCFHLCCLPQQVVNEELAEPGRDGKRKLLGLNPQARWQVGRDRIYNYVGQVILLSRRLQSYASNPNAHLHYMCDATPYNLGQELFQELFSGAEVEYMDDLGLDGLAIVLVTKFRDPAPTKIISTSASKDGKMLAETVRSTYKFFKLKLEDTSRSFTSPCLTPI
jgi:hypothetical protein